MIVFAGIVPCSPLLLPSVNPEFVSKAEKTRVALKILAQELFAAHPDTIVIFCAHENTPTGAFSVSVADPHRAHLKNFGDLGYEKAYKADFMLADGLQRSMRNSGENITLVSTEELPFTATVPLSFLTEHLPNVKILPIAPCNDLTAKEHFDFGASLREVLVSSPKRIAIIAAGDSSHTRTPEDDEQNREAGKKLDDLLLEIIAQKNTAGLLQLNTELLVQGKDASHKQLSLLFGALESAPVSTEILSHEAPFGIGHTVAELRLE